MVKTSGIGDNLYVNGYDLSGDVGSIESMSDTQNLQEVTGLDKSAVERIALLADGAWSFSAFFNDAALAEHAALKTRGSGDKIATYLRGTTLGNAAAGIVGKQVDYAGTRNADGSIGFAINITGSDGDGMRWGRSLTAGKRTDTSGTNGSSVDNGAATSFGLIAYLEVFALTGTNVVVTLEDSANNSAWAAITGGAFTSVTSAPGAQRIRTATDGAVRRYVRAVSSGTFSSATFAVVLHRRAIAD